MELIHLFLLVLYVFFPLAFVLYYRTFYIANSSDKKIFLIGFFAKILGALSACAIYTLYYGGGDTTNYFYTGHLLSKYLLDYPESLGDVLFSSNLSNFADPHFYEIKAQLIYWRDTSSYTISKIGLVLSFITYGSFIIASILCSYISFYASWVFYRFISSVTSVNRKYIGYMIFLMPSVVFWGSGLFKDTFTLIGLYLFVTGSVTTFGYGKFTLRNIFFILLGAYLLWNIRSFFILSISPFLILWIYLINLKRIPSISFKILMIPVSVLGILFCIAVFLNTMTSEFQELSVENILDRSKGFQSWHTTLKGSAYSLGEVEYTPIGILKSFVPAINVTYFRPYLWEANKPIILLSAFQSIFFLLFTFYIISKTRFFYFIPSLGRSPEAIALLGFSLFFAFVVGFTSYNFGALDRYKIPCLSTYCIALLMVYEKYKLHYR